MNDMALTETTYYILLSLWQPQHGYGIMQRAAAISGDRVRLAAGTLYGALSTMTEKGWIELIPEAQAGEHSNIGTIGAALGFALMMVLDVALG